jgi:Ohr subfamily peroxiredoxin
MKTLFTAEAISKGGRSGTIQTPDRLLNVTLGNPLEKGAEKRGPSPELLFAGAYSACYHGALSNAAKKLGTPTGDSTVRALVGLIEDDQGGYRLAVELHAGEELAHAIKIAKQIDYLGGMPCVTPRPVKTSNDPVAMLRADLENERTTVGRYRERIRQAEAMGEFALSETLRAIIVQEQEHEIDLSAALDIDVPPAKTPANKNGRNQVKNHHTSRL